MVQMYEPRELWITITKSNYVVLLVAGSLSTCPDSDLSLFLNKTDQNPLDILDREIIQTIEFTRLTHPGL